MIQYFNYQYFDHPDVQKIIIEHRGPDTLKKLKNLTAYNLSSPALYTRKGTNFLPFTTDLINSAEFSMPDYVAGYNKTWTEITDQRCLDLKARHFDRPWIMMWSGGIDSTNMVCALIRNFSHADLENITIACNPVSVWENSEFYFKYIEPNFKITNSSNIMLPDIADIDKSYLITGEHADQLYGGLGIDLQLLYQTPDFLTKDIVKDPAHAIKFVEPRTDKKFAQWYYHALMANAQSAGMPVENLQQFLWWTTFNNSWIVVKFRFLYFSQLNNIKNARSYFDHLIHWYDSGDYQQWAMQDNNFYEKVGKNPSEYKLASKKYIYSVNQDNYYMKYKTKMSSSDVFHLREKILPWCCIDDQWNLLNFQDHADKIISMLPGHLT